MAADLTQEEVTQSISRDPSSEDSEVSSVVSPIIAVEVDAEGDVRLEDHEDSYQRSFDSNSEAKNVAQITAASDFSDTSRPIWIVTTAALPWRTGTAVNPLLRALFLSKEGRPVTLMVPWLDSAPSRIRLYGAKNVFQNSKDQEKWIRQYCVDRCNCTADEVSRLQIRFWDGAYNETFGSIFPVVDICATIPADEADICILEEPEHLNWFRVPADNADLGWANKFRHVVGILHTNYGDYVRQYGLGFSAPALNSLSSLVVKAYCHRIIRLSPTLPHLDASKETTVNVHGVRPEFLDPPSETLLEPDEETKGGHAPVYFIGKLIWAKGFERVLELQEKYKSETKEYFRMDVYGSGKDQEEIQKAFFGRRNPNSNSTVSNASSMSDESNNKKAALLFEQPVSLRDQITQDNDPKTPDDCLSVEESTNTGEGEEMADLTTTEALSYEDEKKMCDAFFDQAGCTQSDVGVPLEILGDLSGKTYSTSMETAGAALRLIDSVISVGFSSEDGRPKKSRGEALLSMAPAKTRFKWRRRSLPARFLGVLDHILIRDIPEHKVFLNMSTSEVLCTTSAEALAMGKFVILPKHPSNEFFLQFPNCLAYESIEQCVLKLQYALENTPEPMSEKFMHVLSWEGATERFIKAASMTVDEVEKRKRAGLEDADVKAARFHVDTAKRSSYFGSFLRSKILKQI